MANQEIQALTQAEYKAGFVTDIEQETLPPGLNEDVVRSLSATKGEPEWMTEWRLKAYRHWLTMKEPTWAHVKYPPIDYQAISYYSAPKPRKNAPAHVILVTTRMRYASVGGPGRIPGINAPCRWRFLAICCCWYCTIV